MPERRDYLPVCNDQGVPLTDFQAMFCIRCMQPECTRSQTGSQFEMRTSTWEERLFKNPDRMPKDDPLYAMISAKRFIEIDGRIPEVNGRSEWVDPRVLEEPPTPPPAKPRAAKKPRETPETEAVEPAPAPKVETPSPLQSRVPKNSSFQQGLLLPGGGEATAPQKPKDLWEAAPAVKGPLPKETAPIVRQGARLRFGAPGVEAGKGEPK